MDTLLIHLTDQKTARLLHELEKLKLIRILKEVPASPHINLSEKYKGIINEQQGKELNHHVKKIRSEWSNI